MNALREREINNNLERRLSEEQKLRGESRVLNLRLLVQAAEFLHSVRLSHLISQHRWSRSADAGIELLIFSRTCCKKSIDREISTKVILSACCSRFFA